MDTTFLLSSFKVRRGYKITPTEQSPLKGTTEKQKQTWKVKTYHVDIDAPVVINFFGYKFIPFFSFLGLTASSWPS